MLRIPAAPNAEDAPPTIVNGGTVPRLFVTKKFSDDMKETINGRPGSGLVRHLETSARAKGVIFLLRHKLARILRESPLSGRVLGITAQVLQVSKRLPGNERESRQGEPRQRWLAHLGDL
jgi:hypothetical protein